MFHQCEAVALFVRDFTEQVKNDQLRAQVQEEKLRVSQLENLSSVISHEMRTPLSTSLQFIDIMESMMQKMKSNKLVIRILRFTALIKYSLSMNLSFVSDLLDMRMITEQLFEGEETLFDPEVVLNFIKDVFYCQASRQKISIVFIFLESLKWSDISKDLFYRRKVKMPFLIGDKRRLQQVLINLVKNALKFSKDKGFVRIYSAYDYDNQELMVKVEDNGIGIQAEDQKQLFNMFGKLQRTAE